LNKSIIDRSRKIERGLLIEGKKIQANLPLEQDVIKQLVSRDFDQVCGISETKMIINNINI
jgi:hypothetical protein